MPKSIRRATVTRTVTYTATIDMPGYPEETDSNILTLAGGFAGNTGVLSISELLAGSIASNGVISRGSWSVTGTSTNVEAYISRPTSTALTVGTRVASTNPPAGYGAATSKMFVVTTAGTTGSSTTEPNWNTTDGGTTTDGTVTYTTIPKFPSYNNFAISTSYNVGQIVRPSATSLREYLVISSGISAASAPTWTSADNAGDSLSSNGAVFKALITVKTYAQLTTFALGDVVKSSSSATDEYIVTVAGTTNTTAVLSTTVGSSTTLGTVTFKRIV